MLTRKAFVETLRSDDEDIEFASVDVSLLFDSTTSTRDRSSTVCSPVSGESVGNDATTKVATVAAKRPVYDGIGIRFGSFTVIRYHARISRSPLHHPSTVQPELCRALRQHRRNVSISCREDWEHWWRLIKYFSFSTS